MNRVFLLLCSSTELIYTVRLMHRSMALWFWIAGWFLTVMAALGNGFVIYLIATRHRLRTASNWIVLSLALADLLFVICYFPAAFCYKLYFDCQHSFRITVVAILMYASVMNLCALTVDRYIAIVIPLRYGLLMTSRRVVVLIIIAWLLSLAVATFQSVVDTSVKSARAKMVYEIMRLSTMEIVPGVSLVTATVRMLLITRRHQRQAAVQISQLLYNKLRGTTTCQFIRARRRYDGSSVPVICAVVAVFLVCYAFNISLSFCMGLNICDPPIQVRDLLGALLIVNSGANPFAYAFFKKDIKNECKGLLWRNARMT